MCSPTLEDVLSAMEGDRERLEREHSELEAKLEEKEGELATLRRAIEEIRKRAKISEPGRFSDFTKFEAAIQVLEDAGKPLGTAEIVDSVLAGGYPTKSPRQNFYRSLYGMLSGKAEEPEKHGIRKVGKKWALTKWNK